MSEFSPRSVRHGKQKQGGNEVWDWLQALAIAMLLALIIRYFVFSPFSVAGPSMMSTLHDGDRVLVNKVIYYIRDPKPGEVVIFHAPTEKDYIKRIIGVPGQEVSAQNNYVRVDGEAIGEPYLDEGKRTADFGPVKVPEGYVFVMGDNRTNSSDSREIGPVPIEQVVGRADVIFWPIRDFSFLW